MKKAMWVISIFSLVVTAVVLQFMPDSMPMHYDMEGKIDRWGSKYENLIFPIIILLLSLFWHLFLSYYEKKAAKTSVYKERAEAFANAKVIKIVGVSMAAMFTIEQGFFLYSSYMEANNGAAYAYVDVGKVSCISCRKYTSGRKIIGRQKGYKKDVCYGRNNVSMRQGL